MRGRHQPGENHRGVYAPWLVSDDYAGNEICNGGRLHRGKNSFVEPEMFRAMYPQVESWLETKAKYDPEGVFTSDLGRRVGLV